ncbi:MAG: peptidase [Anaerolineae bacterium]
MPAPRLIICFLDGVGLGSDSPETNPFARYPMPFVRQLLNGQSILQAAAGHSNGRATLLGLDAALGVPGLPQSATGQTAILTGLNAPAALGRHYGPYPNAPLKTMLAEHNLFSRLLARRQPVAYAGAYPDRFLDRLGRGTERLSANTRAARYAGLKLRGPADLQAGRALSGLLTNRYWQTWGYNVPLLTPRQAGEQLVGLSRDHALTYFELWYTDVIGHKQDMNRAGEVLALLDDFLAGIGHSMDAGTLLLLISDHGNFEDLSTKQHTPNPALCLAVGTEHRRAAPLRTLTDIAPFALNLLAPPPTTAAAGSR